MNCMNCTENMVAKRKDKRYANGTNVLRPLRPPTTSNQSSWQSSACSANGAAKGPVIVKEMPFFCFDVLFSHIYRLEPPKLPHFTNDP